MTIAEQRATELASGAPRSAQELASWLEAQHAEGYVDEVEIAFPDHFGHTLGKRLPIEGIDKKFLKPSIGICNATLVWDLFADVKSGGRLTDWESGHPDFFVLPDLPTARRLPWRPSSLHVIGDAVEIDRSAVRTAPRTVLRRVIDRLASHGFTAQVGVEIESFLIDAEGNPLSDAVHCYSLEKANELDPVLREMSSGLASFVPIEAVTTEYGPGQIEINLNHRPALEAADDSFRFKYAARELARRAGARITFMAKPYTELSGSSMHVHVSLWRDGQPAFSPVDGSEDSLMASAVAGLVEHLPGLTVFGAPTVNSYKRYADRSYAPTTAAWGGDNRSAAVRSLADGQRSARIELRTPGADANPYWAVASVLAGVVAGIEQDLAPGERSLGELHATGRPLPRNIPEAVEAARADAVISDILGDDAVYDYTLLVSSDHEQVSGTVTDFERARYLDLA
jgi:glutamine synthetase